VSGTQPAGSAAEAGAFTEPDAFTDAARTASLPIQRRPADGSADGPADRPVNRPRDQYIDGLRALALVRVMTYHTFGWVWLPVAFPSMGVMFALGGSLVAASLSRERGRHWQVLRKRVRRLLPPLWLYGAVLVTVMSAHGWTVTETAGAPLTWRTALSWVVPLTDPPGSAWGYDFVLPLWYIRTYLWLLLLSPMLLWLFRRYPIACLAAPVTVLAAIAAGALATSTDTGDTIEHLATFGACWMLGFAHHDGLVRRLPRGRTVLGAALLMALGLGYALARPQPDTGWDIDNISLANAFYSAGAVLMLLRLYPRRTFLERTPRLSRLVTAMNSRAMTIYLWGNVSIWAATPVIESNRLTLGLDSPGPTGQAAQFLVAWLVLVVVVLAVGWAEDVAAGRRPRVNPWPRAGASTAGTHGGRRKRRLYRPQRSRRLLLPAKTLRPGAGIALLAAALVMALAAGLATGPGHAASGAVASSGTGIGTVGTGGRLPVAGPPVAGVTGPSLTSYPSHDRIPATVFWIGAIGVRQAGGDGQSVVSAWDTSWTQHYGGCDGVGSPGRGCRPDVRLRVAPDFYPTAVVPKENPYYVGLPYNDLSSTKSTDRYRIPWATAPGFADHLHDRTVSFLKNRWVGVTGPGGTCYAQVEDSGPGATDPGYVLGTDRPAGILGINLSPAVVRCIGLDVQAGSGSVGWQFVDAPPAGPWARIITTRQVS
jgi:peptidoglycan/LPS O-acetylase OafA/YrhL